MFNSLYLNSIMAIMWVVLPSAGGKGEATSLNIRDRVERRLGLAITGRMCWVRTPQLPSRGSQLRSTAHTKSRRLKRLRFLYVIWRRFVHCTYYIASNGRMK